MLSIFPDAKGSDAAAPKPIWFDLLCPTDAEVSEVEGGTGFSLPGRGALSEVEASSRLRHRDGVLTMSMPTAARQAADVPVIAPLGFVLSPDRLVTIRYTPLGAFDEVAARLATASERPASGTEIFVELCEESIDRLADGLEHLAEQLGQLSLATFHPDENGSQHALKSNRTLREQLRQVGRIGDRLGVIRDALLGLSRVLAFTEQLGCAKASVETKNRVTAMRQDLASLADYDEHLANKVQFVLDALVGLISIAQNDIFKVLTIVSIVGIPPTLIAGIYGMNFKYMPEYNWSYGYPYGLAIIALSAALPAIWFKLKGWF